MTDGRTRVPCITGTNDVFAVADNCNYVVGLWQSVHLVSEYAIDYSDELSTNRMRNTTSLNYFSLTEKKEISLK